MIKIHGLKINQFGNESTYIAKLSYLKLNTIVRYTNREINTFDPFNESTEYLETADNSFFQRNWDESRLKKIAEFIKSNNDKSATEKIPLFPTPIIISLDRDFEYEETILQETEIDEEILKDSSKVIIFNNNLFIPEKDRIALVVDGQHRLKGIEKYIEITGDESIQEMDLPVVFIIGLDLYKLSEVFANINFEQKRVNKSLYYDIFGTLPNSNEIKFTHELALYLNNNKESALHNKINLLGFGNGYFSQALFVDLISKYFKLNGIGRRHYENYVSGGDKDKEIAKFMIYYFNSIKDNWQVIWRGDLIRKDYNYVLCNSTGMGAMFRLINNIFPRMENLEDSEIKSSLNQIFSKISNNELKEIFDKSGNFGKSGSYGLQTKLYKLLIEKLELN